jgi:hypothetical protein
MMSVCFLLSSCSYVRYWRLKKQFSHFDQYFQVADHDGIVISFLEPLLRSKDVIRLAGYPSICTSLTDDEKIYHFFFTKIMDDEDTSEQQSVQIYTTFSKDRLTSVRLIKEAKAKSSYELVKIFCSALGTADFVVSAGKIAIKANLQLKQVGTNYNKDSLVHFLGRPSMVVCSKDKAIWNYKYSISSHNGHQREVTAKFHFKIDDKLTEIECALAGIKVNLWVL